MYNTITYIKFTSFCMTIFSTSLVNITVLTPQSRDCSYYVSRPIPAPPPLWPHKNTDLRAHNFAHSPHMWHQPRLAEVTSSWRLCGTNPSMHLLILHTVYWI